MLIAILYPSFRAEKILRENARKQLATEAKSVANLVNEWAGQNNLVLRNLSQQNDIISMDPQKQKPSLKKTAKVYENITLTTVGLNGTALATSDDIKDINNYSDRSWFKGAIAGQEVSRETLISRTTGKTRLCLATGIRNPDVRKIVGAIVMCRNLARVTKAVGAVTLGKTGYAFIVDAKGKVVAHPDINVTDRLVDLSIYPPVRTVLKKKDGAFVFTDDAGKKWMTHLVPLENGWGVIVQQQEGEVLQQAINFGEQAILIASVAVLVVGALTWMVANNLIRPIRALTNESKAISEGKLNRRVKVDREDELGVLAGAFNCMAGQLKELIDDKVKSAMDRSELEKGRQIQKDFLPDCLPQPDGWELAAFFEPARQVAGDFYDAFLLADGKVGFVIGDVCDKGVGSALFMALFRSLLRAIAQQEYDSDTTALKNAVEFTNNYISTNHSRTAMFATIFFGVLDPKTGELHYINGGHEPPIIISLTGEKTRLKPTGPAVGMLPDLKFTVEEAKLLPGDILIAYTDGVPEAKNPEAKFFTEKKLLSLLELPMASATMALETIQITVQQHISTADQFDDITLLAVKRA